MKIQLKDLTETKRLIAVNGFTQKSFAEAIGISAPYVSHILSGKLNPGPKIAKKISEGLNVDFDHLFFIETVSKKN